MHWGVYEKGDKVRSTFSKIGHTYRHDIGKIANCWGDWASFFRK